MKQLVKRTVTPAMAAANQANSLKSTGPVTDQGLTISRPRTPSKHWGRTQTIRPCCGGDNLCVLR